MVPDTVVRINPGAIVGAGSGEHGPESGFWAGLAALDAILDVSVTSGPVYGKDGAPVRRWRVVIRPARAGAEVDPIVVVSARAVEALEAALVSARERGWAR